MSHPSPLSIDKKTHRSLFHFISFPSRKPNKEKSSEKNILVQNVVMQKFYKLGQQIKKIGKKKPKFVFLPEPEDIVTLHKEQSDQMRKTDSFLKELTGKAQNLRKSLCLSSNVNENPWYEDLDAYFARVATNRRAFDDLEISLKRCLDLTRSCNAKKQERIINGARESLETMLQNLYATPNCLEEENYQVIIGDVGGFFDNITRLNYLIDKENEAFHLAYDSTYLRFEDLAKNKKYRK